MPEPIVTLNEEGLKSDLHELVRKTVEDTLAARSSTSAPMSTLTAST